MAHFAELNENNVVLRVIVVNNENIVDFDGVETEQIGIDFCQNLLGGRWIQTSYNKTFRKNYAGPGFIYDEVRDAFISPKPFDSWILNEETCQWQAPIPKPTDESHYLWDETLLNWVQT